MNLSANYFELFGLPARFALDRTALDQAYRELQATVHPDKFAHAGEAEQRVSMQWATRANEAYQALRRPLSRARYLLELAGAEVGAENNTAMPVDFLIEQMEWREAVDEARQAGAIDQLEGLQRRLRDQLEARYHALGQQLDDAEHLQNNLGNATSEVRKLMFLEKLQHDIDDILNELEDA